MVPATRITVVKLQLIRAQIPTLEGTYLLDSRPTVLARPW